jgi:subtilisin family serine protease
MDTLKSKLAETSEIKFEYSFGKFFGYSAILSDTELQQIRTDERSVDFVEKTIEMHTQTVGDTKKNINLYPNGEAPEAKKACVVQREATWGLDRIGERDLLIDGLFNHDNDAGRGVDAYIVDTGIYTEHSEFEGRATWGFDAVNSPSPKTDQNGHGTHCAGTVGAQTYGVAKSANLIAVAVLGATGSGSTAGVIAGVDYVANDHQAKSNRCVANMSLGGGYSLAMNRAVTEAVAAGCQFAVAAGNENNAACLSSPASEEACVTVSSSDNTDSRSYFSNYGICSNIFAPGSSITSTWIGSPYAINTISGTSMAAPHVCGVMATMLSNSATAPTPAGLKSLLASTATKDLIRDPKNTPNDLAYIGCA